MLMFKYEFIIICPVMALTYMDPIQAGCMQLVLYACKAHTYNKHIMKSGHGHLIWRFSCVI